MSAWGSLGRQWDRHGYSEFQDPGEAKTHFNQMANSLHGFDVYNLDWNSLPTRRMDPAQLRGTQAALEKPKHDAVRQETGERPIQVVRAWGQHFVYDGHHRADLAAERGTTVAAQIYDADATNKRLRR